MHATPLTPDSKAPCILLVDDKREFAELFAERQRRRHPELDFVISQSPVDALKKLSESFDLVIADLDMPEMDGRAFFEAACRSGFDARRVVIHSATSATDLHRRFQLGECLAVINKLDPKQQAVLDMILDNLCARNARRCG